MSFQGDASSPFENRQSDGSISEPAQGCPAYSFCFARTLHVSDALQRGGTLLVKRFKLPSGSAAARKGFNCERQLAQLGFPLTPISRRYTLIISISFPTRSVRHDRTSDILQSLQKINNADVRIMPASRRCTCVDYDEPGGRIAEARASLGKFYL